MFCLVSEINFQIYSIIVDSLAVHYSIHLLVRSSSHLCHRHRSQHLLFLRFTLSLLAQNLPFHQILPTLTSSRTPGLSAWITGLDQTYYAQRFIFSHFKKKILFALIQ